MSGRKICAESSFVLSLPTCASSLSIFASTSSVWPVMSFDGVVGHFAREVDGVAVDHDFREALADVVALDGHWFSLYEIEAVRQGVIRIGCVTDAGVEVRSRFSACDDLPRRARGCGSSGRGRARRSARRAAVKARWWCTSSMLAFCSATHAVTLASEPGRSRTSTITRARRPARTMPRSTISASISGSMLPPPSTRPTLPAAEALAVASAARRAARRPRPRPRSSRSRAAARSPARCRPRPRAGCRRRSSRSISRVSLPGSFTAMPSAMVEAPNCGVVPRIAWYIAGKRTISTPTTSIDGLERLGRDRDAGDEPAAADRRPPARRAPGARVEHLQADGALPRDDLLVVVGMHEA